MNNLLRTTFIERAPDPMRFERVPYGLGRAALGWYVWWLLADLQQPMTAWHRQAWQLAVRRSPGRAVAEFAESQSQERSPLRGH